VSNLDLFALRAVLAGVGLGLLDEPVDLLFAEGGRGGDRHGLLATGALVLGLDVENAVGVDVERDLDLGHATRGWRDAVQVEATEGAVVPRHLALALENVDLDRRLVVSRGGEHLRPRGW